MSVRIQEADFDLGKELAEFHGDPRIGAVVAFVGLVRDSNDAARILEMTLEHYPGMTEKALAAIVSEAGQRWSIIDALVIHRVGRLRPTDRIVAVAVAAEHRGAAFDAGEFIIDQLKTRAPFWKRELTTAGARWVEARETDEQASERWQMG
ncbi:MAG: molybdopterin synthase catalytic subunit MoaE [Candidatus Accumulibacter sp.]|nr:molybdopterin synthase catalytic subunit MoaE [Accumulibacter sp.]